MGDNKSVDVCRQYPDMEKAKIVYPRKKVNCDKSELATKQLKMYMKKV